MHRFLTFILFLFTLQQSFSQSVGKLRLSVEGHFDSSQNWYGPRFLLSITNLNDSLIEIPTYYNSAPIRSYADITYEIFKYKRKKQISLNLPLYLINRGGTSTTHIQLDREESFLFFVEILSEYFEHGNKYLIRFYLKEYDLKADYTFFYK
jgi:hypothetical protein